MGFASFSGPIRIGTVKEGASANMGLVELVQFYTIPFGAILTSPAALSAFTLPAGARITEFTVEVTTALVTATNCGIVFGKSGTANFYCTTFNSGATVAKVSPATIAAATVCNQTTNIGTADMVVTVTPTAATGNATAGEIVVGVRYIQRSSSGAAAPTSA